MNSHKIGTTTEASNRTVHMLILIFIWPPSTEFTWRELFS